MKSCLPRVLFSVQQCSFGQNGLGTGNMGSFHYCLAQFWVLSALWDTETSQTWPSAFGIWTGEKAFITDLLKGATTTSTRGRNLPHPILQSQLSHLKGQVLACVQTLQQVYTAEHHRVLAGNPAARGTHWASPDSQLTWVLCTLLHKTQPMEVERGSAPWYVPVSCRVNPGSS